MALLRLGVPLSGRSDLPMLGFAGDLPCAWCRVAWHRLRAAACGDRIEICWLPFQLDPTVPKRGMPFRAWLTQRFGGPAAADAGLQRIQAVAAAERLLFDAALIKRQPNSTSAHRLVVSAARQGKGVAAVDMLFQGFFERGRDIGDETVLDAIAKDLGVERRDDQAVPAIPLSVSSIGAVPVIIDAAGDALVGCQPRETIAMFAEMAAARHDRTRDQGFEVTAFGSQTGQGVQAS